MEILVKIHIFTPLEISENLYKEGYCYITNADFSNVIVEEMKARNSHLEEMDCKVIEFEPYRCGNGFH